MIRRTLAATAVAAATLATQRTRTVDSSSGSTSAFHSPRKTHTGH